MTQTLKSILSKFQGLIAILERNEAQQIIYESELQKVSSGKPVRPIRLSDYSINQAIDKWRTAENSGNYSELDTRTVRILSGVREIATVDSFVRLLHKRTDMLTTKIIRSLLHVYYLSWVNRGEIQHLEDFLSGAIRSRREKSKLCKLWNDNLALLVGSQAPKLIAKGLVEGLDPPESFFNSHQILGLHSAFGSSIVRSVTEKLLLEDFERDALANVIWTYFVDQLLSFPFLEKEDRDFILSTIIAKLSDNRSHKNFTNHREFLKNYIINHPQYGDPRVHRHRFLDFDPLSLRSFISWLSEEDISLFFELIIQTDPHRRKPFWLNFVGSVQDSLVVVGEADQIRLKNKLSQLAKSGRRFESGVGLNTSAFILNFGKYVAVEFSEKPNACYIYKASDFKKYLKQDSDSAVDLRKLKDQTLATHRRPHQPGWSDILEDYLGNIGIERD